ncbi:hypothetical protein IC232_03390 [Microvirga sp. BT688]|uniref:hypothetical protein n=1 Tax=Microvirga sp. TaxID=1873136 RepID=UPI001689B721|nr:hypothetical protein [Microvirga sp.]MBD2745733.1 hypothetical protein [Microvirga sp.]
MIPHIDLNEIVTEAGGAGLRGEEHLKATALLAKWHQIEANASGVVVDHELVVMAEVGQSQAKVKLVQTGRGHWLTGYDFRNNIGGACCAPGVWDRIAFREKDDAIRFYADSARTWFRRQIESGNSCLSVRAKEEASKMIDLLARVINPPAPAPRQLSLF